MLWNLGKWLPQSLAYATTGFLLRLGVQVAQRRIVRRLVAREGIDLVHQPGGLPKLDHRRVVVDQHVEAGRGRIAVRIRRHEAEAQGQVVLGPRHRVIEIAH